VSSLEYVSKIKQDLAVYIDREKAEFFPRFFNAYPGGYGEGDQFLGIKVPDQRKVAKKYYRNISLEGVQILLRSPIHEYRLTANIAEILLNHEHDLIHKAVGWMLREVGKKDFETEFEFLKMHYKQMPRTMLRYAIEKFEPELRQQFLKGLV